MTVKVEDHFNDGEIIKLNIKPEAQLWKETLKFLEKEVVFLKKLVTSELVEKIRANPEDAKFLTNQLDGIKESNDFHLHTMIEYARKLEGIRECDDVQCENYFLKDHLILKAAVLRHFKDVRTAKTYIYDYFQNGFGN